MWGTRVMVFTGVPAPFPAWPVNQASGIPEVLEQLTNPAVNSALSMSQSPPNMYLSFMTEPNARRLYQWRRVPPISQISINSPKLRVPPQRMAYENVRWRNASVDTLSRLRITNYNWGNAAWHVRDVPWIQCDVTPRVRVKCKDKW